VHHSRRRCSSALRPSPASSLALFSSLLTRPCQVETAKLYQTAGVNPLAGCLPTIATIPVFIGLYRALSNVADEGLLTEGFFWIPSLAGPTKLNGGLGWLTLVDGAPPLGWADTARYLALPVLLVVSQFISQKIISPQQQTTDPQQQQTQAILKFIPLMIGWFSLSVPSGLTLYWFTNNLVTTAQQVWLRRQFDATTSAAAAAAAASPTGVIDVEGTYIAPKQPVVEKPSGEDDRQHGADLFLCLWLCLRGWPPARAAILLTWPPPSLLLRAGKELSSRRSPKQLNSGSESDSERPSPAASSRGGDSRGEKFRAIKAREAARKASAQAGGPAPAAAAAQPEAAPQAGATVEVAEQQEIKVPDAAPAKESGFAASGSGSGAKKGSKKKK
jgi:YidC/Oxa1 family membrane protein insertase